MEVVIFFLLYSYLRLCYCSLQTSPTGLSEDAFDKPDDAAFEEFPDEFPDYLPPSWSTDFLYPQSYPSWTAPTCSYRMDSKFGQKVTANIHVYMAFILTYTCRCGQVLVHRRGSTLLTRLQFWREVPLKPKNLGGGGKYNTVTPLCAYILCAY